MVHHYCYHGAYAETPMVVQYTIFGPELMFVIQ